jgi:hypothetical protein
MAFSRDTAAEASTEEKALEKMISLNRASAIKSLLQIEE